MNLRGCPQERDAYGPGKCETQRVGTGAWVTYGPGHGALNSRTERRSRAFPETPSRSHTQPASETCGAVQAHHLAGQRDPQEMLSYPVTPSNNVANSPVAVSNTFSVCVAAGAKNSER